MNRLKSPYSSIWLRDIPKNLFPPYLDLSKIEQMGYETPIFLVEAYSIPGAKFLIFVYRRKEDKTIQNIRITGPSVLAKNMSELLERFYKVRSEGQQPIRLLSPADKAFFDGEIDLDEFLRKTEENERELKQKLALHTDYH